MNRRDFIKAALAIPAIAALPAPIQAVEELLDGITYVMSCDYGAGDMCVVETWHKSAGKIWRCLATEDRILSLTEEPFCPWVTVPWHYPPLSNSAHGLG